MDDKLTPLEAEVLEMPAPAPKEPVDSYGTAPRPRPKRSYVGLWVCVGLLVIAICTVSVVAAVYHVQFIHDSEGWRLTMKSSGEPAAPQTPVRNLELSVGDSKTPVETAPEDLDRIGLTMEQNTAGTDLTPAALYERIRDGVVCIELQTYYGTVWETGVVISADGYILTAMSSTADTVSATVSFSDGASCAATLVDTDRTTGICILKIDRTDLSPLVFSDGAGPAVGSTVYTVDNPYGSTMPNVFSEAMLSASRSVLLEDTELTLLKTSNSLSCYGCPILDARGHVLALTAPVGGKLLSGASDPCLAVSAGDLKSIVGRLSSKEESSGPWLGFEVQQIPEEYRFLWGYPEGLWVSEVGRGTPVDGVICAYDIILSVDGEEIKTREDFDRVLSGKKNGDTVELVLYRNGKRYGGTIPVITR